MSTGSSTKMSMDGGTHIRRKKMAELKMELGQIGMRRGSFGSITSAPRNIKHVDEWKMDLSAAEKKLLEQAEAKASAEHGQRPHFYLQQNTIKVIFFIFFGSEKL